MSSVPPIADWQELARSKRESVAAKIPQNWLLPSSLTSQFTETSTLSVIDVPQTCGLLTDKELDITENYDATELVKMMTEGSLKSVDVVTAFCKRAAIAQQCVNCLTEIMFDEAMARARECDEYLKKEGKPIGPLHGLPISLKVSILPLQPPKPSITNLEPRTPSTSAVSNRQSATYPSSCTLPLPKTQP